MVVTQQELGLITLSRRERQTTLLLLEDIRVKEVAAIMGLSPKTIDSFQTNVFRKLGVQTRTGLVRWAIKNGVIEA